MKAILIMENGHTETIDVFPKGKFEPQVIEHYIKTKFNEMLENNKVSRVKLFRN